MNKKTGHLTVESENIFPIIKQWLYSDQEIFLRELVSNAIDALNKRNHLIQMGDADSLTADQELHIRIHFDPDTSSLTIRDNGLGMDAAEVDRYINQIAYSGLLDFAHKYEAGTSSAQQVIGHFGIGFYSAFMVARRVTIESLSYRPQAEAVFWSSEDGLSYTMDASTKPEVGTEVCVYFDEAASKIYSADKIKDLIRKYCSFMPYPIYFTSGEGAESQLMNEPHPLWLKDGADISEQEYIDFYRKEFAEAETPLFWIHLNIDYPFHLKGILYFPRVTGPYMELTNRIKVYAKQVFVADNLREMIPEYLFLLQGVLDCPDLPLNVSRSYLQNDVTVRSLSKYIVNKVTDKLNEIYRKDRPRYEEIWPKLETFVKVGSLQDPHFAERMQKAGLLKQVFGGYRALEDLTEGKVYYVHPDQDLGLYVRRLTEDGQAVYLLNRNLDLQWIGYLERAFSGKFQFLRADSYLAGARDEGASLDQVSRYLKDFTGNPELKVEARHLGAGLPIIMEENEGSRRLKDLQQFYAQMSTEEEQAEFSELAKAFRAGLTCVINSDHPLAVSWLSDATDHTDEIRYAYQIAQLARQELSGDDLATFLHQSIDLLSQNGLTQEKR